MAGPVNFPWGGTATYWDDKTIVVDTRNLILGWKETATAFESVYMAADFTDEPSGGNCENSSIQFYKNGSLIVNSVGSSQTKSKSYGNISKSSLGSSFNWQLNASYSHCDINTNTTIPGTSVSYSASGSLPLDSIAPTVTIVPTSSGSLINGTFYTSSDPANFTVSAVDDAAGTGVKHIVINGVTYAVTSRTHTVSGSGLTTITASAEDYAGNITPNVTYDVFIDQTAPSVAIQSQNPIVVGGTRDYHNSSSVDIQIDTSDSDSGLDDGDLIINGSTTTFATIPTQTSYTTTINSAQGIVEGLNTVEYVSKDVAGNQNTANTTFYVDTTAPDGYIVFSSQNKIRLNGGIYYTNLTEVDVDLHFGDSGSYPSGVSKGLIKVNNTATPTVADFASGIDFSSDTSPRTSYNVTGLVNGQVNTLTFFVMDSAENISAGDTISVTVEQINPSGSIQISSLETPKITKSTTNYINDGTVELNLTHSDSESDLF